MRVPSLLVATLLWSCAAIAPASAAIVTTCGQTISGFNELGADLDCTGMNGPAVNIAKGGALAMNGFTIQGGLIGINCDGKCRVTGPGTVRDAGAGINAYGKLDLERVDVVHNSIYGVQCFVSCKVTGPAIVSENGFEWLDRGEGIRSTATLKLDGVIVSDNTVYGINVTSYPNHGGKLLARNCVFGGNGIAIWSDKRVTLTDSIVTGNPFGGILLGDEGCPIPGAVQLKGSTAVTVNGYDFDCGVTRPCADVMACRAPKVAGTASCGTSYVNTSGLPGDDWGVCTND